MARLDVRRGMRRAWMRMRSLFVPSVSLSALFHLIGVEGSADAVKQVFDWERDRLFTLAKGAGGAAVGVITTIVVDAVEGKSMPSTTVVVLAAVLSVLLLGWAAFVLTGLRRLGEQYPLALAMFGRT